MQSCGKAGKGVFMRTGEKTIDNCWVLDDQNRLLSKGGLDFRYTVAGKMHSKRSGWASVNWEKLLATGTWIPVTDLGAIDELNSALRMRIAHLEDSPR
jgi:hypothetical protein